MPYAVLQDVLDRMPQVKITETSRPTHAEASNIVATVEAKVNGIVRGLGFVTPVPATAPQSREILKQIVIQGSIAQILKTMYYGIRNPDEVGANDAWKDFEGSLKALSDDRNPFTLPDAPPSQQVVKDELASYGSPLEASDETDVFRPSRNQVF